MQNVADVLPHKTPLFSSAYPVKEAPTSRVLRKEERPAEMRGMRCAKTALGGLTPPAPCGIAVGGRAHRASLERGLARVDFAARPSCIGETVPSEERCCLPFQCSWTRRGITVIHRDLLSLLRLGKLLVNILANKTRFVNYPPMKREHPTRVGCQV